MCGTWSCACILTVVIELAIIKYYPLATVFSTNYALILTYNSCYYTNLCYILPSSYGYIVIQQQLLSTTTTQISQSFFPFTCSPLCHFLLGYILRFMYTVATFVYYSTESKETKNVNVRVNPCEMLSAEKRHACVNMSTWRLDHQWCAQVLKSGGSINGF